MLIAGVIYYKQSHERLGRLIDSFVSPEGNTRVDAAVFLDGPYAGLSDDPGSGEDTYRFIWERCQAVGVQCQVFGPKIWGGEASKRTAAATAARLSTWAPLEQRRNEALGQERWYLVIDSDEWLESDIDWGLIEKQGTGCCVLRNWRDGDWALDEQGEGAKMVRIMPLLNLVWGPAHYDVMDLTTGITFTGHEKGLHTPQDPCVTFGHDVGTKTIAAEYEQYNDGARVEFEGKLLRIARISDSGDTVVVRMDNDQVDAEWPLGQLVKFPQHMMPANIDADINAQLVAHQRPAENGNPLLTDLIFERIPDDQVERVTSERAAMLRQLAERDAALLERRRQKQARKAARAQRRAW